MVTQTAFTVVTTNITLLLAPIDCCAMTYSTFSAEEKCLPV